MRVEKTEFGTTPAGERVAGFTLEGGHGVAARVIEYGAALVSLEAPDREGRVGPVVLGFEALEPYLDCPAYLGATVGRFANRIADGSFSLEGRSYRLTRNRGRHHLHGGARGFDKALWRGEATRAEGEVGVRLRYRSPDGEEGYPGALDVSVSYRLDRSGGLRIDYRATTDRATLVNLAHHSYFNLESGGATPVLAHEIEVEADDYLVIDEEGIPTGEIRPVEGTPLDFRSPRPLGAGIDSLVASRGGYDHTFVLRDRDLADSGGAGDGSGTGRPRGSHHQPGSSSTPGTSSTEPDREEAFPSPLARPLPRGGALSRRAEPSLVPRRRWSRRGVRALGDLSSPRPGIAPSRSGLGGSKQRRRSKMATWLIQGGRFSTEPGPRSSRGIFSSKAIESPRSSRGERRPLPPIGFSMRAAAWCRPASSTCTPTPTGRSRSPTTRPG
jgi:aldose 1-epimerase